MGDIAFQTRAKINEAKEKTGYSKVIVVAHSMGGLLTRAYIQSDEYENDIDRFIMLGTPNSGSCDAYFLYEGGNPDLLDQEKGLPKTKIGGWIHIPYGFSFERTTHGLLKSMTSKGLDQLSTCEIRDFIQNNVKSLRDLMPTYPCLTRPPFGYTKSYDGNIFLSNLNKDPDKNRMVRFDGDKSKVRTLLLLTNNLDTINEIVVTSPIEENGCFYVTNTAIPLYAIHRNNGDGTVIAETAIMPFKDSEGNCAISFLLGDYGEHAQMYGNELVINTIIDLLNKDRVIDLLNRDRVGGGGAF